MEIDENKLKNKASFEDLPYHNFIGVEVTDVEKGYAELRLPVKAEVLNANGALHGGIYYTVCDLAASSALWTLVSEDQFFVTNDINVSVLAAVYQGEITAKANILKKGKRLAYIEANVFDDNDQLVAASRITKTILTKKGQAGK
ncbi:HotDog domain [Syntrophomonas zehnderi OL-4]|uniref:HotDog domain n=1 Tax=Syntrophomonas zehnderi OL-4 TaxID=690567 RepID=A0A0E4C956_9FIRM|nr:PaaI family thioesterase [Syntrophomonas zehnderi]CFX84101.1 HotDog domain [Syntrophomonas zehnderi OL-4]